jgi:hypothetical protein
MKTFLACLLFLLRSAVHIHNTLPTGRTEIARERELARTEPGYYGGGYYGRPWYGYGYRRPYFYPGYYGYSIPGFSFSVGPGYGYAPGCNYGYGYGY